MASAVGAEGGGGEGGGGVGRRGRALTTARGPSEQSTAFPKRTQQRHGCCRRNGALEGSLPSLSPPPYSPLPITSRKLNLWSAFPRGTGCKYCPAFRGGLPPPAPPATAPLGRCSASNARRASSSAGYSKVLNIKLISINLKYSIEQFPGYLRFIEINLMYERVPTLGARAQRSDRSCYFSCMRSPSFVLGF